MEILDANNRVNKTMEHVEIIFKNLCNFSVHYEVISLHLKQYDFSPNLPIELSCQQLCNARVWHQLHSIEKLGVFMF